MAPRAPAWVPLLLLLLLLLLLGSAAPGKLCGRRLGRALVRLCGGPRWAPEARGDRELLQWLEGRHLQGLVADGNTGQQPPPQASPHRRRRALPSNPAHSCCLRGCTWQDLLTFCPH
ncbi:insulin-like 3 [Tamandua tetradactyla]|uniref:insulin-like 3 n=1 Tax=Tamandua tetradactyla TaxID=48850 RepID=UPI0040544A2C